MKCPRCWADKAYLRQVAGWKGLLLNLLLLRPMRCHHCYHKFLVPRFLTIGKRVTRRPVRTASLKPSGGCLRVRHSVSRQRARAGQDYATRHSGSANADTL